MGSMKVYAAIACLLLAVLVQYAQCHEEVHHSTNPNMPVPPPELIARTRKAVHSVRATLLSQATNGSRWLNYAPYLGTQFISQFYIVNEFFGRSAESHLDAKHLRDILLKTQWENGCWEQIPEPNKKDGTIDGTIFNYWFLKASGEDINAPHMVKARNWIMSKGGLPGSSMMTKIWLYLYGNGEWESFSWFPRDVWELVQRMIPFASIEEFASVPLFIFDEDSLGAQLVNAEKSLAQWAYAHVLPMGYLRYHKTTRFIAPRLCLSELMPAGSKPLACASATYPAEGARPSSFPAGTQIPETTTAPPRVINLVEKMFKLQQPTGMFGAYSVSSMFCCMSLYDFVERYPGESAKYKNEIESRCARAFKFTEELYFLGSSPYLGVLDDGHFWDTMLIGNALFEAGVSKQTLMPVGAFLQSQQVPCGGVPFGQDFWYAPDTDDTGETVLLWLRLDAFSSSSVRALTWLIDMQNDNGGWAAFDKNRESGFLISTAAHQLLDSAELFDPSCVDVSSHILEAFGEAGIHLPHPTIEKAVQYIHGEQESSGAFPGRWGIAYIYATGAAVVGLERVGVKPTTPWVRRGIQWLASKQNPDGGFGESTQAYDDPAVWAGRGISTASQTAWALQGLLEARRYGDLEAFDQSIIEKAVEYLVKDFETHGMFTDPSCTGTGHRGLLYMVYPSYAPAWTLMVLSRYLNYFAGGVDA